MALTFALSTTGNFTWSTVLADPSGQFSGQIHHATLRRSRLRSALKTRKRVEEDQRDDAAVIKVIQDYVPYLFSIKSCVESDVLLLQVEPVFSWRTMLSSRTLKAPPRIDQPSIYYELTFVLLTYALALANVANHHVQSLGDYERQRSTSDAERKRGDERINTAVDFLCRASGLLDFVAQTVLPKFDRAVVGGGGSKSKPPECNPDVIFALAKLCLADAERLAIRRLLSRAIAEATLEPGAPLPKSHPSPALLAKLQLNVYALYDGAKSLLPSSINSDVRSYVGQNAVVALALGQKWLGVDAGEQGRVGEAIAWLKLAKEGLDDVVKSSLIGSTKAKKVKSMWSDEVEAVEGFLKGYTRLNDKVSFQSVPPGSSLLSRMPAGRAALASKPFTPPPLLFGPGIESKSNDDLGLNTLTVDEVSDSEDETPSQSPKARYAGSGGYY